MYRFISPNKSPNRKTKNWRVFEREAVEKHFGRVIDCNGENGHSVLDTYFTQESASELMTSTLDYINRIVTGT